MPEENKLNPAPPPSAPPSPKSPEKIPLSWIFLGIGAIIIMWALSSWLFR